MEPESSSPYSQHSLPEQLTGPKLLKKLPEFYGARKIITVFTTFRHCGKTQCFKTGCTYNKGWGVTVKVLMNSQELNYRQAP
jgi:hypothetical protein